MIIDWTRVVTDGAVAQLLLFSVVFVI